MPTMKSSQTGDSFAVRLLRRQPAHGNNVSMIIGFAVVATIIFSVSFFCFLRNRRQKKQRLQRYQQAPLSDPSDAQRPAVTSISSMVAGGPRPPAATVDRTTSIRSIMTLPAYRPQPSNDEQVLGREGERGGVDVVLEMPTEQDLEEMRENEMESLYQIRLARRLEMQEREERRRMRREARQNNDQATLRQLREQRQAASERNLVASLREEHDRIKNQRHRAVPSVAYADVGIARHDGTRVRGTSMESERVGLLSDAASISASMQSPRHTRDRSGSVMSVDSDMAPPTTSATNRTRSDSQSSQIPSPGFVPVSARNSISTNRPMMTSTTGNVASPPEYEAIPLDTTTSRQSPLVQSGLPTEPPPIYDGAKPNTVESDSLPAIVNLSLSSAPMINESEVSTESETRDQLSNGNHLNSASAGPLRLPSLRLSDLPQIVVQPSPTDLQRLLVPEEHNRTSQTEHS